jgi:hypothetical protein
MPNVIQAELTYKFNPRCVVPLTWLAHCQWVALIRLVSGLTFAQTVLGRLLLGPPAEVEGSQHWNVDTEACKHELDAA